MVGDKSEAIDCYSRAVTEMENGLACSVDIHVEGELRSFTDIEILKQRDIGN